MTAGYDFAAFGLSEMVRAAAALRTGAERAADFADAARSIVQQLWAGFVDADGVPALQLVRLFTTRQLPEDQRRLVLEAAAGVEPDDVAAAPIVSALVAELGVPTEAPATRFGVVHVPVAEGSARVPDQEFVAAYGIASVVAFGGVLPDGDVYCVVMFSRAPIPAEAAEQFRSVAVSVGAGLLAHPRGEQDLREAAQRDALREHLALLEETSQRQRAELEDTVARLRTEAALVDTLQAVGRRLTAQLDMDALVQDATDAATQATGAAFGAFFYNLVDQYGESYTLYTLSGVPRSAFDRFPMPRNTEVFAPTFHGEGTVRSDDIAADPRFGRNEPYCGMPPGHLPVRSYLAVSVVSPSTGEVLGGFFFGHPERARFTERHATLAEGIAGYAGIALDNARLFGQHARLATELTRTMLPTVPAIPGLDVVSRYLPAAIGPEVGGDWFDVIQLPVGRTGLVIGDVVGRGVAAAAVMGQIRTAVRSYALLDMPPADVLEHSCELAATIERDPFITCLYAVHDPVDDTLTVANAGHLPAVLLTPDGTARHVGERLGMPLGVGSRYRQETVAFPPGSRLVLYTDGLVETRDRGITEGVDALVAALGDLVAAADQEAACDELIERLTKGQHNDDVALLYVHNTGVDRPMAALPLTGDVHDPAAARAFVTARLAEWGLSDLREAAVVIASELVTNAIVHAESPICLRLHHNGGQLIIDVEDHGTALPRVFDASPDEARHRGLAIVRAYAHRWGTRATAEGKVVWAEITRGRRRW